MKLIKYFIFILLIAFIGVSVYFGTQDGSFSVKESKEINAPVTLVFNEVKDFKNWEQWASWMKDKKIKIHYPDQTSGEGASYSWKSNEFGDGEIKTLSVIPEKSISQKIAFKGDPVENGFPVTWTFEPDESGTKTKVSWAIEGDLGLFEKICFAMQNKTMQQNLSEMYTQSLNNLDSVIQKDMTAYSITIEGITQHSGGFYLYTTAASKQSELGVKIPQMLAQIENFTEQNSITANGNFFMLYHQWDELNHTAIFSVCVPTAEHIVVPENSDVLTGLLPVNTVLKTTLKGNYNYLSEAWETSQQRITDNGWKIDQTKPAIEMYPVKLPDEINPARWVTEIYIPLDETSLGINSPVFQ